jgi:hypothetical protein
VNTFRSTLPGRYGHGDGFVTKNLGKRNGALNPGRLAGMVTQLFMRLVNAEEKGWCDAIVINVDACPSKGQVLAANTR